MRKSKPLAANESGMALLMALMTVSFLVAITVQLMITVSQQATVAASQREQVRLDALLLGGLQLVRTALAVDAQENTYDSVNDCWADWDKARLADLTDDLGMELDLTVEDLSGRLQVNALGDKAKEKYRAIWRRFLLSGRFAVADEDQAEALIDALCDWVDEDGEEGRQGAESPYYQSLESPYFARNGEIQSLEELLLVKGMTRRLLYGDGEHEGIAPYITIYGDDGKFNLNTAPLPVLEALSPEMTRNLAQDLIEFRKDSSHAETLANPSWYLEVSGIPHAMTIPTDMLTVNAKVFAATISARSGPFSRTAVGIVQRDEGQKQSLLSWKID